MMQNAATTTTAAQGIACWSCSAVIDDSALFCPECGKIQPPLDGTRGGNYFSVFGLVPMLNLDLGMLEHQFHKLSRKLHPDRFGRASEQEKEWSLAQSSLLNDAYRTLKDPLTRTYYLLRQHGAEIGEEFAGKDKKDPSRVPADLLEEVFELNMQLEEMRMGRKMGEVDEQLEADLKQAEKKFLALQDEVDEQLRAEWTKWDEGDAAAREAAQKTMVALLDRRRYLSNLVRDVTETLGAE